jgi:glycerol kinase
MELWATQAGVAAEAVASAGLEPYDIAALGITNQRETTLLWHRETGRPIYPAIVWSDLRTRARCDALFADGRAEWVRQKTGLLPTTFASAFKIAWILDHVPNARRLAAAGKLCFGTVDTWLVWNCTGRALHVTDASNASRTLLYNIDRRQWDPELRASSTSRPRSCRASARRPALLDKPSRPSRPPPCPSPAFSATSRPRCWACSASSRDGQKLVRHGLFHTMMTVGPKPIRSCADLFTTVAWEIKGRPTYALEGCVFSCASTLRWLRETLFELHPPAALDTLFASVPDSGGVTFLPAFEGLGAPLWRPDARASLSGLSLSTTRGHLVRARSRASRARCRRLCSAWPPTPASRPQTSAWTTQRARHAGAVPGGSLTPAGTALLRTRAARLRRALLAAQTIGFWAPASPFATKCRSSASFSPVCRPRPTQRGRTDPYASGTSDSGMLSALATPAPYFGSA